MLSSTDLPLVVQVQKGTSGGKLSVTAKGKTVSSITDFRFIIDSVASGNAWTRKTDFPGSETTFVNSFLSDANGYLFFGKELWQYNPAAKKWRQKKSLPSATSHRYAFCFVIGSMAYMGLGAGYAGEDIKDNFGQKNYNEVWEYNARQNDWTQKRDFPGAPRAQTSC